LSAWAAGCAHNPTPEEIKAKSEQAAGDGRSRFYEELSQRNVTWYVPGQTSTGFNAETGLPEQPVSTLNRRKCGAPDFVKAHNDAILEYMRDNGPIPRLVLSVGNDLFHTRRRSGPPTETGSPKPSARPARDLAPGGQYTLTFQISVRAAANPGAIGRRPEAIPRSLGCDRADGRGALSAPAGADLAYTRWPTGGGEPIYAAMNLRDGRWIVVQHGGR